MIGWWTELPSLLAWTLHWAICVSFVSAAGLFAVRLIRRQSAYVRHTVACSIFCLLVVLPAITAAYHWNILGANAAAGISVATLPTIRPATPSVAVDPTTPSASNASSANVQRTATANLRYWIAVVLCSVWFTGTLVRGTSFLAALRRRHGFATAWESITDANVLRLLETLKSKLGMRRVVSLSTSTLAPAPFTVGIVKPTVVLPMSLAQAKNLDELESVLIHELAHVQRFDYAVSMFSTLMEHLYWWNPFLGEIRDELVAAREEICDHAVLTLTGSGETLANYLFVSLEQLANERFVWGVGMSIDPKTIELRINQLITGENEMKPQSKHVRAIILCISILSCVACVHVNYGHAELVFSSAIQAPHPLNDEPPGLGPLLITADGLTIYHQASGDMYLSNRASVGGPWMPRQEVVEVNAPDFDGTFAWISPDGSEAYGTRGGGVGRLSEIFRTTRASKDSPWSLPVYLPEPINSSLDDGAPRLTTDGLRMVFSSERNEEENYDLWEARRSSLSEAWTVEKLGGDINSEYTESWPFLTGDGLTLLFGSNRPDGFGSFDIYYSTRESVDAAWSDPVNAGPNINTAMYDNWPVFWKEGGEFYFLRGDLENAAIVPAIFQTRVVPEPATSGLAISGLLVVAGLLGNRRRKRHSD